LFNISSVNYWFTKLFDKLCSRIKNILYINTTFLNNSINDPKYIFFNGLIFKHICFRIPKEYLNTFKRKYVFRISTVVWPIIIIIYSQQLSNEPIYSRLWFNDYFALRYDNITKFSSKLRIVRFNNIMIIIIKASERTGWAIFHRLLLQHDKLRNIIPPSRMPVMNITIIYNKMLL